MIPISSQKARTKILGINREKGTTGGTLLSNGTIRQKKRRTQINHKKVLLCNPKSTNQLIANLK
jgi:hypothetical protein